MNASVPAGTICQFGTFRTGSSSGEIIAPASKPYSSIFDGNLTEYANGTIYAFGNSDATATKNLKWIKLSPKLLVSDRNLLCNITIDKISSQFEGTTTIIDGHTYHVRLLHGDNIRMDAGYEIVGNQEWFDLTTLTSSDDIIHWYNCYTIVSAYGYYQSGSKNHFVGAVGFGFSDPNHYQPMETVLSASAQGFRPVLELVE